MKCGLDSVCARRHVSPGPLPGQPSGTSSKMDANGVEIVIRAGSTRGSGSESADRYPAHGISGEVGNVVVGPHIRRRGSRGRVHVRNYVTVLAKAWWRPSTGSN